MLLAEDNESNTVAIGEYLQSRGYRLIVARNGREALAAGADEYMTKPLSMKGLGEAIQRLLSALPESR